MFAKSSILGKLVLQPHRDQSVVRQPNTFKSERPRISKPRFASQVDVNNDLPKPVTTHYLHRERESAFAKPHHMIAPSSSRYRSNDMVHNHYLAEAKKKTQESGRNSRPSVMPSARSQSTANGSKPKPRINNQKSRNWPASKSSCVTTKNVPIAEHSRNSRIFLTPNILFARHVPSNKTTNRNKPVEQTSFAKKPERQIPKGHRFLIKKTSVVHEKTMTPRSCLRWKPTGKIFKTVGLRWVPTGKIFTSSTTKVDSEPTNGSNEDITNQYECEQTLNVSASTLNLSAELGTHDHINEPSSSKLVPKVVSLADKTSTSQQELELLFSPMYEEHFNAGNPSVSKSFALSDNLQQHDTQPTANIHPTSDPINPPTSVNAEENINESDHNSSELGTHDHNNEPSSSKLVPKVVSLADKTVTSQQELELLFSPMYEEHFNAGNPSVSKSFALFDNLQQHDTQPTVNIHPTSDLINPPTTVNAEENM
ncbi:hypothetical protein Tco_1477036 [Tanacetum coccineum]